MNNVTFRVISAASLMCLVMGSIHAFSVFLIPLEAGFSASRTQVSLTYSLALIAVTATVLSGPKLYAIAQTGRIFVAAGVLAAVGAAIAAMAPSLWAVWIGYSLIFGSANGLAYGYGLQISAQVWPGREGLAMGIVTAAYALGAVLSPPLFEMALQRGGFEAAMIALTIALLAAGLISAALARPCSVRFQPAAGAVEWAFPKPGPVGLLWLGYFGGVLAGLMVIGHAAGIASDMQPGAPGWRAPMVIAICNLAGCLIAGPLCDTTSPVRLLGGLAVFTGASLAALGLYGGADSVMIWLGIVGFCYGGTISAYPAAIAKRFGMQNGPRVFGVVFTAWGAAGLAGPWLAGQIFDANGGYRVAILAAVLASTLSVLALMLFSKFSRPLGGRN